MLHTLSQSNRKKKRVGRGGNRGKTAGRGMKGQSSRAGHRIRPQIRDVIQRLPKLRGHGKNRSRSIRCGAPTVAEVSLSSISKNYTDGERVSIQNLVKKGLAKRQGGVSPKVKILASGELDKKVVFCRCMFSSLAREKAEKAGAKIFD